MKQLLAVAFLATGLPVSAQTAPAGNDTLSALLAEVRQLRAAIERSTLVGNRTQITIQRLQTQEARTARVAQDLDRVRNEVTAFQTEQTHAAEQLQRQEDEMARSDTSAARKEALSREIALFKQRLAERSLRDTQTRAREAALTSELHAEQRRMTELQERLNEIDRFIEASIRQTARQ
jgi:predicted  nucleic acid-binding Zn-ribbon protein